MSHPDDGVIETPYDDPPRDGVFRDPWDGGLTEKEINAGNAQGEGVDPDDDNDNGEGLL